MSSIIILRYTDKLKSRNGDENLMGMVINRGNPKQPHYAFTFDDGPTILKMEDWLDALEQHQAVGTFFFTGEWLDRFPQQARLLLSRGHELAPHTYHHRRMAEVSKEVFFEELKLTELAYQEATGLACPTFMRFPYRSFKEENIAWLAEWGYIDIEGEDSGDWAGTSSNEIVERLLPSLTNGVILVHHCNDIAKGTPDAVSKLAQIANDRGLTPVTISELLKSMDISPQYRRWKISIDVPGFKLPFSTKDWEPVLQAEDLKQLAFDTFNWGIPHINEGYDGENQWLRMLSETLNTRRPLESQAFCYARRFADQYWAYVLIEVQGNTLVLKDFATKEFHADALVYVINWGIKIASELGCKRLLANRDMRRLSKLCDQMGLSSELLVTPII
jgi:peptidoglycan/xylan/chitin deacetylase (PgdA/CDA1 family)